MEYGYSLIKHIKINNTDPICAIDLNNELLLFGTMLGYCGFYIINTKKLILVSENEDEHIIATQIKKDKLVFAVGDEKIYIVEKKTIIIIIVQLKKFKIILMMLSIIKNVMRCIVC